MKHKKHKTRSDKGRKQGGRTNQLGPDLTSFTFRIGAGTLRRWRKLAAEMQMTVGTMTRAAVEDYLEELE